MKKKRENLQYLYIPLVQMYSIVMINTYNESTLHKDLKKKAAKAYNGKIEQRVGSYICDVLSENGTVIEIQTKSFKNIQNKLLDLLKTHPVHLIYPLAIQTWLEYYGEGGTFLSRRKSPKKRSIYNIFDELTGLWPVLLQENFKLEVQETVVVKKRQKTAAPVQSANNRRRHKKDWYSFDTQALSTGNCRLFTCKEDYLKLLPEYTEDFCANDTAQQTGIKREQAGKMLWTFYKMQLIERTGKKGKSFMYRIRGNDNKKI